MSIQLLLNADESGIDHVFRSDEEIATLEIIIISDHIGVHANDKAEEEESVKLTCDGKLKALFVVVLMLDPADPVEHQIRCQLHRIKNCPV
ncbi:uncharacterized protein CCR75_009224 [Bremia lactucae]|uniref:Uncharacterized protein n=1 Tax=Bremia lactucae TaxID=4779 RepID=A0A976NXX0_BRELC|nr:hypothetical protein CCR75_009224 [Bremia lactucae]